MHPLIEVVKPQNLFQVMLCSEIRFAGRGAQRRGKGKGKAWGEVGRGVCPPATGFSNHRETDGLLRNRHTVWN